MLRLTASSLAICFAVAMPALQAQTQPDNTKTNQRDRDKTEATADQQKMNQTDRELARQVRRAIVSDKTLSTYAHNVKVIAQNGSVTLKGPVHTEEERKAIMTKATDVAGSGNVKDEMSVKDESGADRQKNP